jgi:hypothetical protein
MRDPKRDRAALETVGPGGIVADPPGPVPGCGSLGVAQAGVWHAFAVMAVAELLFPCDA